MGIESVKFLQSSTSISTKLPEELNLHNIMKKLKTALKIIMNDDSKSEAVFK